MRTDDELVARWATTQRESAMRGWDFSALAGRLSEDSPPWDFEALSLDALRRSTSALDMGTGGGERLIALLEQLDEPRPSVAATEGWDQNLPIARASLAPYDVRVEWCTDDPGERQPFDDASFDLVMNRHEAWDSAELFRILRRGGAFLTQQVDGNELTQLHERWNYPHEFPRVTATACVEGLAGVGFTVTECQDWTGAYRFADVDTLVEYLAYVPWDAPDDFTVERYAERLLELHREAAGAPIVLTKKRFLLRAERP